MGALCKLPNASPCQGGEHILGIRVIVLLLTDRNLHLEIGVKPGICTSGREKKGHFLSCYLSIAWTCLLTQSIAGNTIYSMNSKGVYIRE